MVKEKRIDGHSLPFAAFDVGWPTQQSEGRQPSSTNHSNSINQPTQQWLIDGWNEWGWNEIDVVAFLLRSSIGGLWAVAPPMAPPRRANAEREKSNGINEMKASKQRE